MASKNLQDWAARTVKPAAFNESFDLLKQEMRERWELTPDTAGRELIWLKINVLTEVQGHIEALARGDK